LIWDQGEILAMYNDTEATSPSYQCSYWFLLFIDLVVSEGALFPPSAVKGFCSIVDFWLFFWFSSHYLLTVSAGC